MYVQMAVISSPVTPWPGLLSETLPECQTCLFHIRLGDSFMVNEEYSCNHGTQYVFHTQQHGEIPSLLAEGAGKGLSKVKDEAIIQDVQCTPSPWHPWQN